MGQIMIQRVDLPWKAHFSGLIICVCAIAQVASGDLLIIDPWRPKVPPKQLLNEPNATEAARLIKGLKYSKQDIDHILTIACLLGPSDATEFLKGYIAKYERRNKLQDVTWGRAVFGLGIVQTQQAMEELLRLWDRYDRLLASGKIKVRPFNWEGVPQLHVIGDAIHFYLWDDKVRQWFLRMTCEVGNVERNQQDLAESERQSAREWLLQHLYRWDIIESVDDEPPVTPEKISRHYRVDPKRVKNISRAAERVVYWVKSFKILPPDISRQQWLTIRHSGQEEGMGILQMVADQLGRPLALAIWQDYLSRRCTMDVGELKHRLWLISWLAYKDAALRMVGSQSSLDERDSSFLEDALAYATSLPDGYLRELTIGGLFGIACYAPKGLADEQLDKIRAAANTFLSAEHREDIIQNAKLNRDIIERSTK